MEYTEYTLRDVAMKLRLENYGNEYEIKLQSQLEAAKQRELELRAVIDEIHSWAVCGALATPEDMMQNLPRIVQITSPANSSQALREHEAKVLEEAADCFAGGGWGMTPEDTLRRLAEERRKK